MMGEFLDCLTVDFKGSGETGFVRKYIGIPNAEPIFQTLLEVKQKTKIHVEITDLIVPQVGDDIEQRRKLARWVNDNLGPDTPDPLPAVPSRLQDDGHPCHPGEDPREARWRSRRRRG